MTNLYLTQLATAQRDWLATRQSAIARNVANASTPGYSRVDLQPFEALINASTVALASSHPSHFGSTASERPAAVMQNDSSWERSHSRNNVVLEQEMLNAAEVSRQFTLNINITKSFHEMMLAGLKG